MDLPVEKLAIATDRVSFTVLAQVVLVDMLVKRALSHASALFDYGGEHSFLLADASAGLATFLHLVPHVY